MSIWDYSTSREFTVEGHWWFPDCPAERVPGILTHRPGSDLQIKTIGGFQRFAARRAVPDVPETLHGETTRRERVSVFHPLLGRTEGVFAPAPAPSSQEFLASGCVFGLHAPSASECNFNKVSVQLTQLEPWVGLVPFAHEAPSQSDDTVRVRLERLEPYEWCIPSLDAKAILWAGYASGGGAFYEFKWEHFWTLELRPSTERPFTWYLEKIEHLRKLFSLMAGQPVYYRQLTGAVETTEGDPPDLFALVSRQWRYKARKELHPTDFLAPFGEVEDGFGTVLESWFARQSELASVNTLFFDGLLDFEVYDGPTFLGLTQVIEGCHRLQRTGTVVPPEEFAPIRQALYDSIPASSPSRLIERLKTAIGFSNEASLRERLEEIISGQPLWLRERFFPDVEHFTRAVRDMRNFLAHPSPGQTNPFSDTDRAVIITDRLQMIAFLLLLREASIDPDRCRDGLFGRFGWLTRHLESGDREL